MTASPRDEMDIEMWKLPFIKLTLLPLLLTVSIGHADDLVVASSEFEGIKQVEIAKRVKAAYANLGHTIEFQLYPRKRSLTIVNKGKADAELARIAGVQEYYVNLVQVEEPVGAIELVVMSKEPIKVDGWESLRGRTIGYVNGHLLVENRLKGFPKANPINNLEILIRMIQRSRLDIGIAIRQLAEAGIDKLNAQDVLVSDSTLESVTLYHYVHKKHADLAPHLAQQFRQLK